MDKDFSQGAPRARRPRLTMYIALISSIALSAGPISAPAALAANALPALGKHVKKTTEKGVTVWRVMPARAPTKPMPARSNSEKAVPDLRGGEKTVVERVVELNVFVPNPDFAVGKLRVSGFYSGRGQSTNPVRGFYSGKRRIRPSTRQGFYSGYRRYKTRRFPLERPNGQRAAPLPPGEYAF
ncbi:MAG: hypothetical protein AAGL18_06585 [Pseudomonadota bacterium]